MYFLIILKGFPPKKKLKSPYISAALVQWQSGAPRIEKRCDRSGGLFRQCLGWNLIFFICGSISIYPTPTLSPSRPHNLRPSRLRHNGLVSPVLSNLFNKTKKTIRIFRTNCFISCVASGRNKDDNSTRKVNTSSPIAY